MPRAARGERLAPGAPLAGLPGIGPKRALVLAEAGLETVLDLLLEVPVRHEDRARFARVADLVPGGPPRTLFGTISSARLVRTRRRGFSIFEATLEDESGAVGLVFYNQPWLAKWVVPGARLFVHGRAVVRRKVVVESPHVEAEPDDPEDAALSVGRVVPIYRSLPGRPPRTRRHIGEGNPGFRIPQGMAATRTRMTER